MGVVILNAHHIILHTKSFVRVKNLYVTHIERAKVEIPRAHEALAD